MQLIRTRTEPARKPAWRLAATGLCTLALLALAPVFAADAEPAPAPAPAPAADATPAPGGENPTPGAEPAPDEEPGHGVEALGDAGAEIATKQFRTTAVPDPVFNYASQSNTWKFVMKEEAREPFSYNREMRMREKIKPPTPPDGGGDGEKERIKFFTNLPQNYHTALGKFTEAVRLLSRYSPSNDRDDELTGARKELVECTVALNELRKTTSEILTAKNLTPDQRKTLQYYASATNTLSQAAAAKLETVNLRLSFNNDVLRQPDFKIKAIQANYEDPQWPYGAVKFAGMLNPVLVGETIERKSGANSLELKITALSPQKVTVLFQHRVTFEIPVNLEGAGPGR